MTFLTKQLWQIFCNTIGFLVRRAWLLETQSSEGALITYDICAVTLVDSTFDGTILVDHDRVDNDVKHFGETLLVRHFSCDTCGATVSMRHSWHDIFLIFGNGLREQSNGTAC